MGYRSEVAWIMEFGNCDEAQNQLKVIQEYYRLNDGDYLAELLSIHNNFICFYCDSIKWYDQYEGIKYTESMFKTWDMIEGCKAYRFIRIGEEIDDIEIIEDGAFDDLWKYIDVPIEINVNFPVDQHCITQQQQQ